LRTLGASSAGAVALKIPIFELPSRRASSAGWAQSGAPFLLVVLLVGCLGERSQGMERFRKSNSKI
jgi:hypothetical protein